MQARRSAILFAWLLIAPALLYITVIVAYPLVETFILSFTDASLKKTTNWVGWVNYEKIFNDTFGTVIVRTFIWTFFSVSIKMIIGTFGAAMLNSAVPGRTLFRVLTMPPWIVPMAIGIFMWGWMYNGQFGMIPAYCSAWAGRWSRCLPGLWLDGLLGDDFHRCLDRCADGDALHAGGHAGDPARPL